MEVSGKVKKTTVDDFVKQAMFLYGEETLKHRAIPDFRDGLKPVQRRILYLMHERGFRSLTKAAKIVGNVVGELHPHSDQSVFSALVNMSQTQTHFPLVQGHGNWGSYDEAAGAMRYIECKLHPINSKYFLEYMPIAEKMPNYDGKWEEPVYLPCTVPNLLITGAIGIAVGAVTAIPPHSVERAIKTVLAYLEGERRLKKLVKILGPPHFVYGSWITSPLSERWMMYKKGKGTLYFCADYKRLKAKGYVVFRITGLPPNIGKMDSLLKKLQNMDWVSKVVDESGIQSEICLKVIVKRGYDVKKCRKKLEKFLTRGTTFNWNVTITEELEEKTKFRHVTLLEYLDLWVEYRTELEQKWLSYNIEIMEKENWRLETLVRAYGLIKRIADALKTSDAKKAIMKLKFTEEQATYILSLQLSSLQRKNVEAIKARILATKKKIKDFKSKKKHITEHLTGVFEEYLEQERKAQKKEAKKGGKDDVGEREEGGREEA